MVQATRITVETSVNASEAKVCDIQKKSNYSPIKNEKQARFITQNN